MKLLTKQTIYTTLIASGLLLMTACGGGGGGGDTIAPSTDTFTPDDGIVNVSLDTTVSAVFDEEMMDLSIAEDSFYLTAAAGAKVYAAVEYDNTNNTATLTPTKPLALHTQYTATLTDDNLDLAGNALAHTTWSFKTRDGTWRDVESIERMGGLARGPEIALDSDGNAIAIWSQNVGAHRGIWTSNYTASTHSWGNEIQISSSETNANGPKIVFFGIGKAAAIWSQDIGDSINAIFMRHFTDGVWGPRFIISDIRTSAINPKIVANSKGEMAAAWSQPYNDFWSIYASHFSDERWSPPMTIDDCDTAHITGIEITLDDAGRSLFVWRKHSGLNSSLLSKSYESGVWSNILGLSIDRPTQDIALSNDASGNIMLLWSESDGEHIDIMSRYYKKSLGTWFAAERISDSRDSDEFSPRIAFDGSGNAIAVWMQQSDGDLNVYSNRFTAEGWGVPVSLEAYAGAAMGVSISVDTEGNAIAVWVQSLNGNRYTMINRYKRSVGWSEAASRIENDDRGDALWPKISVNASGKTIAIWAKHDGRNINIKVRNFR